MKRQAEAAALPRRTGRRALRSFAVLCGVLGKTILLLVLLLCALAPLARLCGYEIYNVVSGSMEPAVPVGSAVLVRSAPPAQLAPGDIVAFRSHGTVVTHRVVENDEAESLLVTKGDANAQPDPEQVRYSDVIGRVRWNVPVLGWLLSTYTSGSGRVYLICFAAGGAALDLAAALLRKRCAVSADGAADAPADGT